MASTTPKINLAILDDYQNISLPIFSILQSTHAQLSIQIFPQTLNPNNPNDLPRLINRLKEYQAISTMRERTPFPSNLLSQLPNLKLLLTTGTRNLGIDTEKAKELGIIVAGTSPPPKPTQSEDKESKKKWKPDSTTSHTIALLLSLTHQIPQLHTSVRDGKWQGDELNTNIAGKTLGLCGLGRLGIAIARIAVLAFGMRVIAWSANLNQRIADEKAEGVGLERGDVEVVSKDELFKEADVLSVHYVLSERSRGIVGASELGMMKRSAFLVNTSRGPLIDEESLLHTLKEGRIRGAALDVFDTEPLAEDSEWRSTKWGEDGRSRVVLSPHMGYAEEEVVRWWYEDNAANLKRWLKGEEVLGRLN